MEEHRFKIISLDNSIQKFLRQNGSNAPNPKEDGYRRQIEELYAKCKLLAVEKQALADRAAVVLDRQVKRLDVKIDQLEKEGTMVNDPPLPSLLKNKTPFPKTSFTETTAAVATAEAASPLQATSGNSGTHLTAAQRLSQGVARALQNGVASGSASSRVSSPATPTGNAAALHLSRNQRESSAGANDNKRRRLNSGLGTLPAASSNLRQSSLGPGTPKAGTPGATRAGSAGPRGTAAAVKKPASMKKVAPHQQVRRLKGNNATPTASTPSSTTSNKQTKRSSSATARVKASSSAAGYRKSPANSTAGADEDDSILSSADLSDSSQIAQDDEEADEEEEEEEEDGAEDTRLYCTCRTVSHGDMVACDNDDCPYEWFHWKCVGLTKEPTGTWFCPACRKTMTKTEDDE